MMKRISFSRKYGTRRFGFRRVRLAHLLRALMLIAASSVMPMAHALGPQLFPFEVSAGQVQNGAPSGTYSQIIVDAGGVLTGYNTDQGGSPGVLNVGIASGGVGSANIIQGFTGVWQGFGTSSYGTWNGFYGVGGVDEYSTVNSGGILEVEYGGQAWGTTVAASGLLKVDSGGYTNGAAIAAYGSMTDAGTTYYTNVYQAGLEEVMAGGSEIYSTVANGGTIQVDAGGAVVSASVYGVLSVQGGGVASGDTVLGGGAEIVGAGATESNGLLAGGVLYNSGTTFNETVRTGTDYIYGVGSQTVISAGGAEVVYGTEVNGTVAGGVLYNSGTTNNETVVAGTDVVTGAATNTVVGNGGIENQNAGYTNG
ncbi:TPA: hypothetical protein ACYLN4_000506, partial [Burkholderia lata]